MIIRLRPSTNKNVTISWCHNYLLRHRGRLFLWRISFSRRRIRRIRLCGLLYLWIWRHYICLSKMWNWRHDSTPAGRFRVFKNISKRWSCACLIPKKLMLDWLSMASGRCFPVHDYGVQGPGGEYYGIQWYNCPERTLSLTLERPCRVWWNRSSPFKRPRQNVFRIKKFKCHMGIWNDLSWCYVSNLCK